MTWERTAERYLAAFESARRGHRLQADRARRPGHAIAARAAAPPEMQIGHFLSHVRRHRPVPACRPFRARPCSRLLRRRQRPGAAAGLRARTHPARQRLPEALTRALRRLRPACLESGHQAVPQLHELRSALARGQRFGGQPRPRRSGRWANARAAMPTPSRRRWAAALFAEALPAVGDFRSPRAWAFALLGLDAYCAVAPDDAVAERDCARRWPTG